MFEVVQPILESSSHILPGKPANPGVIPAALGVACVASWLSSRKFDKSVEPIALQVANADQLAASVTESPKEIKKIRLQPVRRMLLGGSLVTIGLASGFTYNTTQIDKHTDEAVVVGTTGSERYTQDVNESGVSRYDAVQKGISTANYHGNLGIIQSGADSKITLNLTTHWKSRSAQALKPQVDPNGNGMDPVKLTPSINLAESLLQPGKKVGEHTGTILIVSDGTVDDSPAEIAATASKLHKEGVKVEVVVPGTSNGTYKLKGINREISSKANPGMFDSFGADSVVQAKSAQEIEQAIRHEVADADTSNHKNPWYNLDVIGAAIMGLALWKGWMQRIKKVTG
jgi:hypothetical protein